MTELVAGGRVWKFGDHINTDLIFPHHAFRVAQAEQYRHVFSANRPGWVDLVKEGDLLVAGANFGTGSGRTIGQLFRDCGIRGVIAETINGLGLRNLVNEALPAIECPGIVGFVEEGESLKVDFVSGLVTHAGTGKTLQGKPMQALMLETVMAGGVIPMLIKQGLIESSPHRIQA